MFSFTVECV